MAKGQGGRGGSAGLRRRARDMEVGGALGVGFGAHSTLVMTVWRWVSAARGERQVWLRGCKKGHRLGGTECYIVHSSRSISCGAGRCDRDGV